MRTLIRVRIMLLGEQLIAFRDTSGRVGVISAISARIVEPRCFLVATRRTASAAFTTAGSSTSPVPASTCRTSRQSRTSRRRVKAAAYPTRERGGLVWAYMGHRETPPPLPDFEANLPREVTSSAVMRECNWLQALEGDIDTRTSGSCTSGAAKLEDTEPGTMNHYTVRTRSPKYMVVDTDFGAMYTAYRPAEDGEVYWRTGQYLFPFYTHIPTGVMGREIRTRAWVPLDDNHTMFYMDGTTDSQPGSRGPRSTVPLLLGLCVPAGLDRLVRTLPLRSRWSNDYLIDRETDNGRARALRESRSVPLQDQAVCESMGPVLNRELEHLGTSDLMVVRVRNLLREAAIAHSDKKVMPPGVEDPDVYRVRSGGVILPEGVSWPEGIRQFMPAYVEDVPIDDNGRPTTAVL